MTPDIRGICLVPGCDQEIIVTGVAEGDRVEVQHLSSTEHKISTKPRVMPLPETPLGEPLDPNVIREVDSGGGRF